MRARHLSPVPQPSRSPSRGRNRRAPGAPALLLTLLACLLAHGSAAGRTDPGEGLASSLLWRQASDGWSQYGPSVRTTTGGPIDAEIADDFELTGAVERLEATGTRGFGAPDFPVVHGVEVRFYSVAADGRPGAVEAEYLLATGDPDLVFDPRVAGTFEITLSPPFQARGRHFVGVQAVMDAAWYRPSANHDAPRGSHLWIRDDLAGGDWQPYEDVHGVQDADVAFALHGTLTEPATITALSTDRLDRSGRLRIFGVNLGGSRSGGQVLIDGLPAWIPEWTDVGIHAYVPETAGPGPVSVEVVTDAGTSAPAGLTVDERRPQGRVAWRFTCDSLAIRHRPGIGPDGTVYAQDTDGILYALSPDGGLRWLLDTGDEGSEGPVVVGHDGTVYAGVNPLGPDYGIVAVDAGGNLLWTFLDSGSQGLIAGPAVGPDGNLYAVGDVGGLGAFSLTPQGALRWSHPGAPPFAEHGQLGIEIAFGGDRFYVAFDERAQHPTSLLYGLTLDGGQLFAVGRPDNPAQPVVGPGGQVYLQYWGSGSGKRLGAYDADGNLLWTALTSPTNTLSAPDVAPDGTVYAVRNRIELRAVDPDGSDRWTATGHGTLFAPIVGPGGDLVVTAAQDASRATSLVALDSAGDLEWRAPLPHDDGVSALSPVRPLFAPGGGAVYVAAEPVPNPDGNRRCYLYAVTADLPAALFADGFESGDTSAWGGD